MYWLLSSDSSNYLMKRSIHDDITQLLKEVTLNLEINECQFKIDDDPLIPYEQWDNCIKIITKFNCSLETGYNILLSGEKDFCDNINEENVTYN